jgi:hypothetical protein
MVPLVEPSLIEPDVPVVAPFGPLAASVPLVDPLFIEPAVPLPIELMPELPPLPPIVPPPNVPCVAGAPPVAAGLLPVVVLCAKAAPEKANEKAKAVAISLRDIRILLKPPLRARRDYFDASYLRRPTHVASKTHVKLC